MAKLSIYRMGMASLVVLACVGAPAMARTSSMISSITKEREHLGQCFLTTVRKVEARLEDGDGKPVPDSGSAIVLADGHYNVDYSSLPGIDRSKAGDRVRLCVILMPSHCPAGDTRGIRYRGRNLRTGMSWVASDAEHMCGGA